MKKFFGLVFTALGMTQWGNVHALDITDCQSTDFASGAYLYGDFAPHIKYGLHCLVPDKDGIMTISIIQSDTPVDVKVTQGGGRGAGALHIGEKGSTREIAFPVQQGKRIDLRLDPLVGSNARTGRYVLFASTAAANDPNRFTLLTVINPDTMSLYPGYSNPEILEKPITIAPNKMVTIYIPPVGHQPHLRFNPVGIDPEHLVVGIIDLSTGKTTTAQYKNGYFPIPLTDPNGMLVSLGSKSLNPLRFTVAIKVNP